MTRKEKVLGVLQQKKDCPLSLEELAVIMEVPPEDRPALAALLEECIKEGTVLQTRRKKYALVEFLGYVRGNFQGNERGFGFVLAEPSDLFIPAGETGGALHGDLVLAKITRSSRDRREGEIVRVLERANKTVIGSYEHSGNHGFVVPDDKRISKDIYIPKSRRNGAKNGQKVVAEITDFSGERRNPEGRITEILGDPNLSDTQIRASMRRFGIQDQFPPQVLEEAERTPKQVTEADLEGRRDFRNRLILTIDGDDAKDFDDAISLERMDNGHYLLGVHIADVSHYVTPGSPLDQEAYRRGTSVYLPDRVVPMLPEALSNGICSLQPGVDRLTMSIEMEVDQNGTVTQYQIAPGVIHSRYRMTYHNVTRTLEDPSYHEYDSLREHFQLMRELAHILHQKRQARGSLDFDFPEAKIKLDENGRPIAIEAYEITVSNHIIEEFMLLANETVAEHVFWLGTPLMYRVHEPPTAEKAELFSKTAKLFGYTLRGKMYPKSLQAILEQCRGKREERILSVLMLRSMMKAEYRGENLGHFGLAAKYYCHFTSPIRRYPDLTVHRVLKELCAGTMSEQKKNALRKSIPEQAAWCSATERSAEEAERDVVDMKKAEYMQQFIGDDFDGAVSGVTSFGLFVELPNTVEGLVRITSLEDDEYQYDEEHMMLIGRRTGHVWRIGDPIRVKLIDAKPALRQIDFMIEEEESHEHKNNPAKQKSKARLLHHRNDRSRHRAVRHRGKVPPRRSR